MMRHFPIGAFFDVVDFDIEKVISRETAHKYAAQIRAKNRKYHRALEEEKRLKEIEERERKTRDYREYFFDVHPGDDLYVIQNVENIEMNEANFPSLPQLEVKQQESKTFLFFLFFPLRFSVHLSFPFPQPF